MNIYKCPVKISVGDKVILETFVDLPVMPLLKIVAGEVFPPDGWESTMEWKPIDWDKCIRVETKTERK